MGSERKSSFISEKVKKMTAYHEVCLTVLGIHVLRLTLLYQGGHALVALYTEGAMPLHKVTCIPRGRALGVVCAHGNFACLICDLTHLPFTDKPTSRRRYVLNLLKGIPCYN